MATGIFTIVRDEGKHLDKWFNYYSRHFDPKDIFILDNESSDGSTDQYQNVEKVVCPHGAFDHLWLLEQVTAKQRSMLNRYKCVVFTECDEFLVHPMGLKEYLQKFSKTGVVSVKSIGYEICQLLGTEPDMKDVRDPINKNRKYWKRVEQFDKTLIGTIPLGWTLGFHRCHLPTPPYVDNDLLLIHTHYMDLKSSLEKQAIRNQYNLSKRDSPRAGAQNKMDVVKYEAYFKDRVKNPVPIPADTLKLLDF